MKEMSLDENMISEEQQAANRHLKSSAMILTSMTTSLLIYPPLVILHIPFILYIEYPIYKTPIQAIFQEKKIVFLEKYFF